MIPSEKVKKYKGNEKPTNLILKGCFDKEENNEHSFIRWPLE